MDKNDTYGSLSFSLKIKSGKRIEDIFNLMENEISKIYNILDEDVETISNEAEYTKKKVIPAIIRMGMKKVRYNHGIEEYGKDIVYKYTDNFDDICYGAAQVKYGNISGRSNGDIDVIISQIDDAFQVPYRGVNSNERNITISQVLVICSGKFTKNAEEKIRAKVNESYNIKFFDGQCIDEFLEN